MKGTAPRQKPSPSTPSRMHCANAIRRPLNAAYTGCSVVSLASADRTKPMRMEIIKVQADRLDPECLVVTLRHVPGTMAKLLLSARAKVVTYKGRHQAWYIPPSFR